MISRAKFVAIAASEAGAGRSFCTASIAMSLARRWRCLVLDLDAGSGNLQKFLGISPVANLDYLPLSCSNEDTERLLNVLRSSTTDFAIARLPADTTGDTPALFAAADVPIVVTEPAWSALEKVVEFLKQCDSSGFDRRRVYMIVNRIQRGGEPKVAAAFVKKIQKNLGLDVGILGTVMYDPRFEAGFLASTSSLMERLQGSTAIAFEDMAYRIERDPVAPTRPRSKKKTQKAQEPTTNSPLQNVSEAIQRIGDLENVIRAQAAELKRLDERFASLEISAATLEVLRRKTVSKRRHVLPFLGAGLACLH